MCRKYAVTESQEDVLKAELAEVSQKLKYVFGRSHLPRKEDDVYVVTCSLPMEVLTDQGVCKVLQHKLSLMRQELAQVNGTADDSHMVLDMSLSVLITKEGDDV